MAAGISCAIHSETRDLTWRGERTSEREGEMVPVEEPDQDME